jgi:hypothetical protein
MWNITCENASGKILYSWDRISIIHPATGKEVGLALGNATMVEQDHGVVDNISVAGQNVFIRFVDAQCYDGKESSERVTVESAVVAVPPGMNYLSAANLEGRDLKLDAIPTGTTFRLSALLYASPLGDEDVRIFVKGPGIDFQSDLNKGGGLLDPKATFTANNPGSIAVWAEMLPTGGMSRKLYITVLGAPRKPRGPSPGK